MFVLVTKGFEDLEHKNASRAAGDVLNVDEKRANEIVKKGYGRKVKVIELMADPDKAETKPAVKKAAKKSE